ncbi:hypothetical protein [Agrococcus baldri]|uniref:Uncharacterized protein n=1 Tax=Agrococcus baldri TaxID=153730 RepID=A0AA87UTC6_9MICO|nr:hypothetical protein [Agrococcus baldri]GEK81360.1 hypothetical protein ABA31_27110 [Agrococcus baldri]
MRIPAVGPERLERLLQQGLLLVGVAVEVDGACELVILLIAEVVAVGDAGDELPTCDERHRAGAGGALRVDRVLDPVAGAADAVEVLVAVAGATVLHAQVGASR